MKDNLRVAAPCDKKWNDLVGDDKRRYCGSCQLFVYNVPALSPEELVETIQKTEGRFCGRLYQRKDGTVLTQDCPVGLRARMRKKMVAAATFVAAVAGSIFGFSNQSPMVMGEIEPMPPKEVKVAPPVPQPEVEMIEMMGDVLVEPTPVEEPEPPREEPMPLGKIVIDR